MNGSSRWIVWFLSLAPQKRMCVGITEKRSISSVRCHEYRRHTSRVFLRKWEIPASFLLGKRLPIEFLFTGIGSRKYVSEVIQRAYLNLHSIGCANGLAVQIPLNRNYFFIFPVRNPEFVSPSIERISWNVHFSAQNSRPLYCWLFLERLFH